MKIAFLFSGQGAQFPGMMKDITEKNESAKSVFEVADRTLDRSISDLCFNGTEVDLALTYNTQPCVLAADLAAFKAIESAGIKADAVAGFSLGEYAALVAAGVIDIKDVFPLIQKRADYMQEAVPVGQGGMAAVMKLSSEEVSALCDEVDGYLIPANYNCPGQIVVSGEANAIDRLCELAKDRKIRVVKLAVSAPFHCELMKNASEKLKMTLKNIEFNNSKVPVFMNVDACAENDKNMIKDKVIKQTYSPVKWEKTILNLVDAGIDTFIELGPGKTLSGFVKKTIKEEKIQIYNVTDLETLQNTLDSITR